MQIILKIFFLRSQSPFISRIKRAIPFPRLPTTPPIILHKACSNNDLEPQPTSNHLTSAILVHLCTAVDDDLVREMLHPRFGTVLMSL